ncbi:MAG: BlaI/MecI/CopY family transcriptional regulator [Clostridia bacterium]|nr:BlaI/MecI/CopY family transcriptional regulator [Clostridia bacterium]
MEDLTLFEAEKKLMDIIWEEAPVESGKLVKLADERLNWNKSTTYTVLRKLKNKGFVSNEDAVVKVLIPMEDVQVMESNQIVEERFSGSLPKFVASFLGKRSLSDKDADELMQIIKDHMGGDK